MVDWMKDASELVPAIVQDAGTNKVLMLGYMNREALDQTISSRLVTFFSRSKGRLWVKGESSGNFLKLESIKVDCDGDTLLIKAFPQGPVCHTGADTCFRESNQRDDFLHYLEQVIAERRSSAKKNSYTYSLFEKGLNKIAQKVGEEAVELVIEAKDHDDDLFLNEAADLMFHYLVLLQAKNFTLQDVVKVLQGRNL